MSLVSAKLDLGNHLNQKLLGLRYDVDIYGQYEIYKCHV